jgi:hypothetical protein
MSVRDTPHEYVRLFPIEIHIDKNVIHLVYDLGKLGKLHLYKFLNLSEAEASISDSKLIN